GARGVDGRHGRGRGLRPSAYATAERAARAWAGPRGCSGRADRGPVLRTNPHRSFSREGTAHASNDGPTSGKKGSTMTPNGTHAITTNGLSKRFGPRKAVDGLTITIPSGTIAGFVGPNGAGKTTTIRMLLGLVRPNEGDATILGRPLSDPQSYLPRVGALVVAPAFYTGLSGRNNIEVL